MANQSNNSNNLDPMLKSASAYFFHSTDVSQKLVSEVFNGSSYGDWECVITIALSAKSKLTFVDGNLNKPGPNSPNYKAWEHVNNVVTGWLIGALDPKIARSRMLYQSARKIWKDLEEIY